MRIRLSFWEETRAGQGTVWKRCWPWTWQGDGTWAVPAARLERPTVTSLTAAVLLCVSAAFAEQREKGQERCEALSTLLQ